MNFPYRQRGMSVSGWMFMVLIIGGMVTVGVKLVPHYLDHNTMSKVLDNMAQEKNIGSVQVPAIYAMIRKRFKVNGIRDFPIRDNIKVQRTKNGVELSMDYEIREHVVGNLELLATFSKHLEFSD